MSPGRESALGGKLDFLAPAVAIMLGREPGADDPEAHKAAEIVSNLATAFGRDLAASRERVRIAGVSAELHAIEMAAAGLAAALGSANPATLDVLTGRRIPNAPFLSIVLSPAESRYLSMLESLAGHYALPVEPASPRVGLAQALDTCMEDGAIKPEWPVGTEALRELARVRRRRFESLFRDELQRLEDACDYGAGGALPPVRRRRSRSRRRANDPASEPDLGGPENAFDLMQGAPEWVLARDSYLGLRRWRPELTPTTTRGGPLHALVSAVYAAVTGESGDEAMEHRVRAAVKIMGAWERFEAKGALSDGDFERRASLGLAFHNGMIPRWLA